MKTIAAITGAGWDPVEEVRARKRGFDIPERTPEMFWRVGAGHTVLSRQIAQFKALGATKVFVGMGEPGCSPTRVEDHDAAVYGVGLSNYGQSPWTDAQVVYTIRQGGFPLLMPDPHAEGETCWSTLIKMMPAIIAEPWDHLVISAGDYVFRTAFLQTLLREVSWPSQFWFWTKHSMEFLTRDGFVKFTQFLRDMSAPTQAGVWLRRTEYGVSQKVWGTRKGVFDWMMDDWMEVSYHSWKAILKLAREDPV